MIHDCFSVLFKVSDLCFSTGEPNYDYSEIDTLIKMIGNTKETNVMKFERKAAHKKLLGSKIIRRY